MTMNEHKENKILEQLKAEAQSLEIPQELSVERMGEKLKAHVGQQDERNEREETHRGDRTADARRKWGNFHHAGRAVAAALVLVLSLGAYRVAMIQPEPASEGGVNGLTENLADDSQADAADPSLSGSEEEDDADTPVRVLGDYTLAESYEQILDHFQSIMDNYESSNSVADYDGIPVEETDGALEADLISGTADDGGVSFESAAAEDTAEEKQSMNYSGTNLQVQGVDESDIVKTDGHYIYIADDKEVQIVDVSTGTMRQLGSIVPELSGNLDRIREMYVDGDRLCLIVQKDDSEIQLRSAGDNDLSVSVMDDVAWYDSSGVQTQLLTYDITAPAGAKLLGTITQDGSYDSSRKIGDVIYLFSDYSVASRQIIDYETAETQTDEASAILPTVQGQTIPADCIYLSGEQDMSGVLMTAMDVNSPDEVTDEKLIFLGYASYYVTADSLYLYRNKYSETSDGMVTRLTRFQIGDGKFTADCAESVPGSIRDTFAIHESGDGYLYVLTTDYFGMTDTNQLYVLDDKLKIYGQIKNIAEGEMVYAARFVDDIGYFITYRNTDPLFTVDFSDRANPTLIGELEIPGFSDYLQFWDDDHLIGVGDETDADSNFQGIKVSLYDISDPRDVKESSKIVLSDMNYAPATSSYKALLADGEKNVMAFLTARYDTEGEAYYQQIFTVKDGKLLQKKSDLINQSNGYEESSWMDIGSYRDLYIGDTLYLAGAGRIISYDLGTYERVQELQLN